MKSPVLWIQDDGNIVMKTPNGNRVVLRRPPLCYMYSMEDALPEELR